MYAQFKMFVRLTSQLDKIDLTTIPVPDAGEGRGGRGARGARGAAEPVDIDP